MTLADASRMICGQQDIRRQARRCEDNGCFGRGPSFSSRGNRERCVAATSSGENYPGRSSVMTDRVSDYPVASPVVV